MYRLTAGLTDAECHCARLAIIKHHAADILLSINGRQASYAVQWASLSELGGKRKLHFPMPLEATHEATINGTSEPPRT